MTGAGPDEQHRAASQRDGTGFDQEGLGRAAVMLGGGALAFYGLRRGVRWGSASWRSAACWPAPA